MITNHYTPKYIRKIPTFSITTDPVANFFLRFNNETRIASAPLEDVEPDTNEYREAVATNNNYYTNSPLPSKTTISIDDYIELQRLKKERELELEKEARRNFRSKLDSTREARGWLNTVRGVGNDLRSWYRYAKNEGWV